MDPPDLCALLTLLVLILSPPAAPCPRPCSCPQPTELHCTFRSLIAIPAAVPKHVERMNLGFNSINKITDRPLAGLRKLELLMVHGNDLHSLPDGVFRDLASLQMLKISYNKLKEINRHTLQGLWSLARLHLDHNRLEFIHPDAFQGLTALRLLQLEGNQLQQLHPATFATFTLMGHFHVSTLRHLYLSDNGLTSLPFRMVATMPQLENLYLHGNPWQCDCNMRWLHDWDKTSGGVLKCKKDKALPGGQLCPMCSSPRHLQRKELHAVDNMVCSGPIISSPQGTSPPEDVESELLTAEDFEEPLGNISLGLSDEHGNEVDLECSVGEPRELTEVSWEQVNQLQLPSNVTFSVDLECPVDREKYEQLWRLIAYYSAVPAHLQREVILSEDPAPTYVYRQDSEKDALYYTGVKVHMMAQPAWLMQTSVGLQLNRLQSSAKTVKLILTTGLSETVEAELVRRQRRTWVTIESTNTTRTVLTAILGSPMHMYCNVHSSGQPVVHWMLPDGSKVKAPSSRPGDRVSLSGDGRLVIKAVSHTDAGIYYCTARVHGDFAVLPFHLTVQESSSPPPGEDTSITPIEGFAGNPISLPCTASGSPDAEINWILPSNNIVSFHSNSSRALVYANGTLHIPQTQLLDSGYYKCIAMNQHGVDTLAAKIAVVRRKAPMRPMRKFPLRPQSASGVNTQIKVPTEDSEEASGDSDGAQEGVPGSRPDPLRRRIPGGVAPGRRGVHPSRNVWRRPPVLRKPAEDRKNTVEGRRRINTLKSKIDPEKWADILAKIRDRNAQSTVTPLPAQHTTQQATQSPETTEGSSDGGLDHFPTPRPPVQHGYTARDTASHSRLHASSTQATTESTYSVQPATHDTIPDLHTSSNSVFFLPQTTSVPLHTVTLWQADANTASSSSSAASLEENHSTNTDVDGDKTADWSKERSERTNGPNVAAGSDNDGGAFSRGGRVIPSVSSDESAASRRETGKYLTAATSHAPKDTTLDLQSEAMLTTASLTLAPAATRRTGSEGRPPPRLRQPNSKRRNGGRRRRPSRRKQKLNEPPRFTAATPGNPPRAAVTASTQLEIEALEVTTSNYSPAVPFTGGRVASSGRLSHKESSVSGHDHEAATSSPPASPPETKAKALSNRTSAAPWFPTHSPAVVHRETHTAPAELYDSSTTRRRFTGSRPPPVKPLEESVGPLGPPPRSDKSSEGLHAVMQTDVEEYQSGHQAEPSEKGGPLPSPSASTASLMERDIKATSGLIITPNMFPEDYLKKEQATTETPTATVNPHHSSSHNTFTGRGAEVDGDHEETLNIGVDVDAAVTSTMSTTPPSPTSSRPNPVLPHAPKTPSTGVKMDPSLRPTTITVTHSQGQQRQPIFTTSDPRRASDFHPATPSADYKLASTTLPAMTARQTPTSAAIQSNPSRDSLLTSTQDASREPQLPGRGSVPRGKPRISKSNFQTFTVKAETDAQLPCEAEGVPMPFLSWTKVPSGATIAQNTRVQRFEVHPNGTLIIRNAQLLDRGQYLCTVQNQYGTDKMVVNLVVLSQHPRVLQPLHRDVTVHLGGKVDLECVVEGHPVPQVTWVLPNHVHVAAASATVPSQQRVAVMSNGTLRISQASYTDRGIYKCIGSSVAGADTVSVRLYISALPPVIQQTPHENTTLPEGSTAYIHCTATGTPQPVIRWITPDGVQLTASQLVTGRNIIVFPNGTLYIRGLSPGNGGRYECSASNTVASSRRTVVLSVRRSPSSAKASITSSSSQRTDVIYGSKLLLNCVATGEPEPRIIWRTPSKKLVDAQYSFDPRIKVFPNGTITIHSVTDKESGDYLCVARNKMGDDYVLLRVNVLTRPAKIEQKQQRSSQEVVYGGGLKVDCVASGLPNPEISWALPDGTMVNPVKQRDGISVGRSRRYVVFDNGTLYFNDVGMPEEGDYTCYAENQLGKDEMKVRVKVNAATALPQIQDKDQRTIRVFYGETVILRCNVKGRPVPVIAWISPTNRVISPALDKYQILDDGTLVIQKVQRFDGGNYTCMARNSAGQDHKVTRLEVLVTPPVINGLIGAANTIKVTAVQDQKKLVDCVAKGTPTPRIMWVLPGNVILPAPYYSNRMAVHLNGSLEIRSPKRTDSGQLACIARNEGGEVRLVVNLVVNEDFQRPQVRGPRTDSLSLTVGSTMTLNCSFEGLTLPHTTWILPNGTPLLSGARFSKFFHRPDGSLIISNPSVAEAGMYHCLGHSSGELVERTITLSPGRKPEINNRYNAPLSVMNGETLLLHCQTTGEPLRLAWTLPSGVVLNRPQRAGRYAILPNGTLAIQQVSVHDRGAYVCRAANEYGSSLLSLSVIVIAYPPRITSGPPSVTYAKRGVAVQLNCVATGIPKAEVAWETPDKTRLAISGQPRLFGNKYLHPQGSLIIQNPTQRDAGVYRCTARNAIGVDSKATFLNVF